MKKSIISILAKILLGGALWEDAKRLVLDATGSTHLTGTEKHQQVVDDLRSLFGDIATITLDTAAQLAAQWALGAKNG